MQHFMKIFQKKHGKAQSKRQRVNLGRERFGVYGLDEKDRKFCVNMFEAKKKEAKETEEAPISALLNKLSKPPIVTQFTHRKRMGIN